MRTSSVSDSSPLSFSAYVNRTGMRGEAGALLDGMPSSMTLTMMNAHRMAQSSPTCDAVTINVCVPHPHTAQKE